MFADIQIQICTTNFLKVPATGKNIPLDTLAIDQPLIDAESDH